MWLLALVDLIHIGIYAALPLEDNIIIIFFTNSILF